MGHPALRDLVTTAERAARYSDNGWWTTVTLIDRLEHHAQRRPDGLAIVDPSGEYSYASLAADTAAVAGGLQRRGVGVGDVVSVQLPNRYETVVAGLAALWVGAVVNPLLPNYRSRELTHVFRAARPAAVFTPDHYRGCDHRQLTVESLAGAEHSAIHVVVGTVQDASSTVSFDDLRGAGPVAPAAVDAGAVSELIFTSGTEAQPKAIMHTEQTANFSVRVAYDDLGLGAGDVVWMPSPIGHSTGFNYGVRFAIYHGLPLVLQDRWDGDAAVDLVTRYRCSYTLAATTFLQDMIDAAERHGADLSSLQFFGCGGAPVPPPLVDRAAQAGIRVLRLYGSTEVLVGTWNRPISTTEQRRSTDGLAMSHVDIVVRDESGNEAGVGQPGELFTRGPNTCVGFFDDPQRTAATFDADGFVASGDLVTMDAEGYVTVVGRKKEIIIRGGVNITPREIEDLIMDFPEVSRVAVIGLPDERLGERMCACVVLTPGGSLDLETLVSRLRAAGLATYKLPQRLEILTELPSTASGKIQKHELRGWLGNAALSEAPTAQP
ncbi:MAG TPA: AMP-binding protein [Ilumatobacteraceae bacterium]|nr:AMP-binding protein [Ilumatobacteraceae bacterium]